MDTKPDFQQWVFSGSFRDEGLLNLYYNAADVFVLPSVAENLPNTLIEATAAGTPSVVFQVGGCPEVVRDGETGFVCESRNHESLADGIERVFAMAEEEQQRMRQNCRQIAERDYAVEVQTKRYQELFDAMLGKTRSGEGEGI